MDMFAGDEVFGGHGGRETGAEEAGLIGFQGPQHFRIASEPDETVPDYNSFPSSGSGQPSPQGLPEPGSTQAASFVSQMGVMFQTLLAQQVSPLLARVDQLETRSQKSSSMKSVVDEPGLSQQGGMGPTVFQPLAGCGVWQTAPQSSAALSGETRPPGMIAGGPSVLPKEY